MQWCQFIVSVNSYLSGCKGYVLQLDVFHGWAVLPILEELGGLKWACRAAWRPGMLGGLQQFFPNSSELQPCFFVCSSIHQCLRFCVVASQQHGIAAPVRTGKMCEDRLNWWKYT